MKKIINLTLLFISATTYFIINCGKPNEVVGKFKVIGTCANPGFAQSVRIDSINHKQYAFVASGQAGMVIYNIDNPESTFIVAQWKDTFPEGRSGTCWAVSIVSNYAYIAYGKHELLIIDVKNLDSLRFVGGTLGAFPNAYAYDIYAADTQYIFIAAREQFIVVDVSDPAYPPMDQVPFPFCARGVFVVDSFAYLACEQLGVYIINNNLPPGTPPDPVVIGNIDTPSNARGIFVLDNTCYVADGRGGLVIIDVTNPRTSIIVGQLDLSGYTNRIYVKDTLAYVACGDAGLSIVNIKNKSKPILVETLKTCYAKGVFVPNGPYIYVADRDEGLIVIKQEE